MTDGDYQICQVIRANMHLEPHLLGFLFNFGIIGGCAPRMGMQAHGSSAIHCYTEKSIRNCLKRRAGRQQ